MSKRKRHKKRNEMIRRRQILKISVTVFLIVAIVAMLPICDNSRGGKHDREMRGVWISYGDFSNLGLYNQTEEGFRKNAEAFLKVADGYGINTVFFHTRAFRDASYDSKHFPIAEYLWDRPEEIQYDPLQIMIELAHDFDMELHAWLNPYRNTDFDEPILDPAAESSTEEILLCVREIIDNYDVDGIHFDDYFYEEENDLPDADKKQNVNDMVHRVYKAVHDSGRNLEFGISPAGNISYCESIGADVKTWLSEDGYVDYIIPQIYWTDQHTAAWRDRMFTDTLDQWCSINKLETDMYVGIAAYKAGNMEKDDPGWSNSDENLSTQVQQVREKNCGGFVFFSASDFYRNSAEEELGNYRNLVF